mgnify:CR=1 FL=1|tara:strand:+ start:881 stop:1498 length:618 start_codon:yes stop_codon:yes gene_type:complete
MKQLMENWRRFIAESEKIALGQCYPFANRMATKWSNDHIGDDGKVHPDIDDKNKFKVVHGKVTDKFSGESYNHAWVEMGDVVFDDQTKHTKPDGIPKDAYYEIYQPEIHAEYNAEESMINCMKSGHEGPWNEAISLDIEVGDVLLGGKYKNKRIEVKEIGEDELGQPTVNGKPILKVRIEKHLPDEKKSKKTLDMERDKGENKND